MSDIYDILENTHPSEPIPLTTDEKIGYVTLVGVSTVQWVDGYNGARKQRLEECIEYHALPSDHGFDEFLDREIKNFIKIRAGFDSVENISIDFIKVIVPYELDAFKEKSKGIAYAALEAHKKAKEDEAARKAKQLQTEREQSEYQKYLELQKKFEKRELTLE